MINRSKEDLIQYRIFKSQKTFEDAILLVENQRWDSCINRLYYSSFYMVSALLLKHDINPKTHKGVSTHFHKEFVKTNLVKRELGNLFLYLFDWRTEGDYLDFSEFGEESVKPLLDKVKEFNEEIKLLVTG